MKWHVFLWFALWIPGMAGAAVLKEKKVLAIAGFQHAGSLSEIVCLSDGKRVLSSSRDDCVRLWEIESGKLIRAFKKDESDSMWGIRVLPGDQEFLVAAGSGEVIRFEIATGKELMAYKHSDSVYRIALHPNGKQFVGADDANLAVMWEIATGKELQTFKGHTDDIYTAIFVENGKRLVTGSSDKTFKTWDIETGKCMETSKNIYKDIYTLALSPNGKKFAMASDDDYIRVFNAKTRMEDWKVKLKEDGQVVAWSPDGKLLAIASDDEHLYILDSKKGKIVKKIAVADSSHTPVAFTTDGKTLISGGDQHLHLHDVETGDRIEPGLGIPLAPEGFEKFAVGPNGQRVYSSMDEDLYFWDLSDDGMSNSVREKQSIYSLAASPDGAFIGVGLENGDIQLRDAGIGEVKKSIRTGFQVNALAFSPTGRSVISGGSNHVATQWAVANGGRIQSFRGHTKKITDIAIAPGGKLFGSASEDGTVRLWSLQTKQALAMLPITKEKPKSLALINGGRSLIAATGKAEVWGRFLAEVVAKVQVDVERISELILKMAAEKFEIRKAATEELTAMGEDVLPHLEKIKANDPEVRMRLAGVRDIIIGGGGKDAIKEVHKFESVLKSVTGDPTGKYWAGVVGYGVEAKITLGVVVDQKLKVVEELQNGRAPEELKFSSDGKTLVSSNGDGTMTVYSVDED